MSESETPLSELTPVWLGPAILCGRTESSLA